MKRSFYIYFAGLIILSILILTLIIHIPIRNANGEVRKMANSEKIKLPDVELDGKISLEKTLYQRRSIRSYSRAPLKLKEVSQLLWSAQGITEKNWGLRTAPSAGALYPLELYVLASNVENLSSGVYRYIPSEHTLVKVLSGDRRRELYNSSLQQESIIQAPVVFVIAAVYERTSIKYGDRAERYVHMEAGHAAQNLLLQAVALGLGGVPIGAFYDDKVKSTLSLPAKEQPLYIIPVGRK